MYCLVYLQDPEGKKKGRSKSQGSNNSGHLGSSNAKQDIPGLFKTGENHGVVLQRPKSLI